MRRQATRTRSCVIHRKDVGLPSFAVKVLNAARASLNGMRVSSILWPNRVWDDGGKERISSILKPGERCQWKSRSGVRSRRDAASG